MQIFTICSAGKGKKTRGKTRKKVKKLPAPEQMAKSTHNFKLVETCERGKSRKRLVYTRKVVWYEVSQKPVKINYKILSKMWSKQVVGADVYCIRDCVFVGQVHLLSSPHFATYYKMWTQTRASAGLSSSAMVFVKRHRLAPTFKDGTMSYQPRVAKVLAVLLVSMTAGAIVLMALGHNPPSAGPFSLWTYYRLDPVKKAIASRAAQSPDRWNRVEIYYSGTKAGNIEQLASLNGLSTAEDINCHFCLYNGLGGSDGQIQPTEKWQRQWSIIPGRTWYGSSQTIRICVISDGETAHPTDCQIRRLQALADGLCKKFNIQPQSIYYPSDWR